MKASILLPLLSAVTGVLANSELPAGVPRSTLEFREKHPYKPKPDHGCRKTVTIRASEDDEDDVSQEFYKGLKKANHGGTLYLKEDETYVIGQPLDLTFLDDVHVHLEGEIKFTNDTPYWQENAFTHPFQVSTPPPILGFGTGTDSRGRTPSCSGSGEARTSRSTARASSTAMASAGGTSSTGLRFSTRTTSTCAPFCSTPRTPPTSSLRAFT